MKSVLTVGIIAVSLSTLAINESSGQEPGQRRRFEHLRTQKEYKALPAKAQMIFACAKCKAIATVTKRDISPKLDAGAAWVLDPCPGCDGKITTKFDAKGDMTHDCTKCGPDSAFCCCQAGKM